MTDNVVMEGAGGSETRDSITGGPKSQIPWREARRCQVP